MASLINGRAIAKIIEQEVIDDIAVLKSSDITPGLAVVLVGDDPASKVYVGMKQKSCEKLGIYSIGYNLPADMSQADLFEKIEQLNANPLIHGILVQLPLPKHLNTDLILDAISPLKDIDGLHPENIGLLTAGRPRFIPCTPYGICELLYRSSIEIKGKEVVVLGRSNLVGRPISILLSQKSKFGNATVTICHSYSKNIKEICCRADILVVAIGQKKFVTGDMIKNGAVVVDVGIHRLIDEEGGGLCGDVNFSEAQTKAAWITPVPGGVGPMTIVMLMRNVVDSAKRHSQDSAKVYAH